MIPITDGQIRFLRAGQTKHLHGSGVEGSIPDALEITTQHPEECHVIIVLYQPTPGVKPRV
jgi:hypothetical protein